jgi:hypothetical protein
MTKKDERRTETKLTIDDGGIYDCRAPGKTFSSSTSKSSIVNPYCDSDIACLALLASCADA